MTHRCSFRLQVLELAHLGARIQPVSADRARGVDLRAGCRVGAQQAVQVELDVRVAGAQVGVVGERALDPHQPRPQRVGDERARPAPRTFA